MRSVVVVLPASMWAMMPMLRTLLRSVSTSCATVSPFRMDYAFAAGSVEPAAYGKFYQR
jgi:hypothetical protein